MPNFLLLSLLPFEPSANRVLVAPSFDFLYSRGVELSFGSRKFEVPKILGVALAREVRVRVATVDQLSILVQVSNKVISSRSVCTIDLTLE